MRKHTTEQFIEKAKNIHGDKYEYSVSVYAGYHTKISIICKIHGIFEQTPNTHIAGKGGCPTCRIDTVSKKKSDDISSFIIKANKTHNNRYDYSSVVYTKSCLPVHIICKIHGKFIQRPNDHINGQGCPACNNLSNTKTTSEFIREANLIHDNIYDYSLSEYKKNNIKLIIICKIHGQFNMAPNSHTSGHQGCPKCRIEKIKNTCLERYGVSCSAHVPEFHEKQQKYRWKQYILPSGNVINIQGYENFALDELLKTYQEQELITQRKDIPEIWYYNPEDQKRHRYFADIWIPKENLIIEVKSEYTMKKDYNVNKLKEEATKVMGYNYKFMIY